MLPAPPAVFLKFDLALDELFILPAPIVHPFAFLAGQLDELILGHMYGLHNMRQKKKNQENRNSMREDLPVGRDLTALWRRACPQHAGSNPSVTLTRKHPARGWVFHIMRREGFEPP